MSAPEEQTAGGLALICAADVKAELVNWIWPGHLAAGSLNMLEGAPGLGKSMACCHIAGVVTTGGLWPDGTRAEIGNVIMINMEDDMSRTIRPRLDAAGADLERVFMFNVAVEGFTLEDDLERLEAEIVARDVNLVFIDPLMAVLGSKTDSNRDQHVRRLMSRLGAICGRTDCGVVMVRHLKKSTGRSAINNGSGSIGIIAAARITLLLAKDPENEQLRILATVKNNLGHFDPNMSTAWTTANGRLEFIGTSDLSADELCQPSDPKRKRGRPMKEKSAARVWLSEELANGPVLSSTLKKRAKAAGFSDKTVERARKDFTECEKIGDIWMVRPVPENQVRHNSACDEFWRPSADEPGNTLDFKDIDDRHNSNVFKDVRIIELPPGRLSSQSELGRCPS